MKLGHQVNHIQPFSTNNLSIIQQLYNKYFWGQIGGSKIRKKRLQMLFFFSSHQCCDKVRDSTFQKYLLNTTYINLWWSKNLLWFKYLINDCVYESSLFLSRNSKLLVLKKYTKQTAIGQLVIYWVNKMNNIPITKYSQLLIRLTRKKISSILSDSDHNYPDSHIHVVSMILHQLP